MEEPIHKCNKEKKIDAMDRTLNELSDVVHKTTNGDSLLRMATHTNKAVNDMGIDVRALLTFQTVTETRREISDKIRVRKERKKQWVIGLLVGTVIALVGILISVIQF